MKHHKCEPSALWDDIPTKLVGPPTFQELRIEHYMFVLVLDSVTCIFGYGTQLIFKVMSPVCVYILLFIVVLSGLCI